MKYQIITQPGDNLRPLRTHMAEYTIDAKYRASTIMSDGSYKATPGFPLLAVSTGVGLEIAQVAAIAVNPVAGVAMVFGAVVLDQILFGKKEGDAPYPAAQLVEVSWRNVSAKRAQWAEYLLCKLCQRQGWEIHTDLLNPRNADYAKRSSKAPAAWKQRRGKSSILGAIKDLFG